MWQRKPRSVFCVYQDKQRNVAGQKWSKKVISENFTTKMKFFNIQKNLHTTRCHGRWYAKGSPISRERIDHGHLSTKSEPPRKRKSEPKFLQGEARNYCVHSIKEHYLNRMKRELSNTRNKNGKNINPNQNNKPGNQNSKSF